MHLVGYNDKFFRNVCEAIGRPELAGDERFVSNEARLAHRDELDALIGAWIGTRDRDQVLAVLWEHDVIVGPVNEYADVFTDPQVVHNDMVVDVGGGLRVTGVPVRLSGTPGAVRRRPPALGEHTAEVLAELGIPA